eukprot:6171598-Pleurochrysis_carterae.AAC.1
MHCTAPAHCHPPVALLSCPTRLDGHGRESPRVAVLEDLARDDEDDHVDIPAFVFVVRHLVELSRQCSSYKHSTEGTK